MCRFMVTTGTRRDISIIIIYPKYLWYRGHDWFTEANITNRPDGPVSRSYGYG